MIDLDAIEARLKAATPGPWESYRNETGTPKHCFKIEITGNVKKIAERRVASTPVCALHSGFVWFEGDGELIANAPTDLAALIAEVLRLREANKVGLDAFGILEHRRRPADGSPR